MRISRFFLLMLILFIGCFWWAGGNNITDYAAAKFKDSLPETTSNTPLAEATETIISAWDRTARIIDLPAAVKNRITTKNYALLTSISLPMQQAIIAVEDNRFYSHSGFDPTAMMRASLVNLQYGHIEEGASTITQQLIKNLFLSQDQSFGRKAEELILAVDMEFRYSKEEILEMYLNTIYFGSGMYGISDAAAGYFGKLPSELSLAESSMLAGLPNAPSLYSPYVDFKAAKSRQAIVLETMVKAGYISPTIAEMTKQEKIWLAH